MGVLYTECNILCVFLESSGLAEAPPPSPTKYVPVASPVSSQGPIEVHTHLNVPTWHMCK